MQQNMEIIDITISQQLTPITGQGLEQLNKL
jgi:hypothetical protein